MLHAKPRRPEVKVPLKPRGKRLDLPTLDASQLVRTEEVERHRGVDEFALGRRQPHVHGLLRRQHDGGPRRVAPHDCPDHLALPEPPDAGGSRGPGGLPQPRQVRRGGKGRGGRRDGGRGRRGSLRRCGGWGLGRLPGRLLGGGQMLPALRRAGARRGPTLRARRPGQPRRAAGSRPRVPVREAPAPVPPLPGVGTRHDGRFQHPQQWRQSIAPTRRGCPRGRRAPARPRFGRGDDLARGGELAPPRAGEAAPPPDRAHRRPRRQRLPRPGGPRGGLAPAGLAPAPRPVRGPG